MANMRKVTYEIVMVPLQPDGSQIIDESSWIPMEINGLEAEMNSLFKGLTESEAAGDPVRNIKIFESDVPEPILTDKTTEQRAKSPATGTK